MKILAYILQTIIRNPLTLTVLSPFFYFFLIYLIHTLFGPSPAKSTDTVHFLGFDFYWWELLLYGFIFLFTQVSVFIFPSTAYLRLLVRFLLKFGVRTRAKMVENGYAGYYFRAWERHKFMYRDQRNQIREETFYTGIDSDMLYLVYDEHNPKVKVRCYPKQGQEFDLIYLPRWPSLFVVLASGTSEFADQVRMERNDIAIMNQEAIVNAAQSKVEFDAFNPKHQEELRKAQEELHRLKQLGK